jgi:hypothetical protein
VYAERPDGQVKPISNGNAGVANAATLLSLHIPVQFHPVAQFGVGYTQAALSAKFSDNGTTASLATVPIFVFGRLWYTPPVSCPSSGASNKAYALNLDFGNRTCTMAAYDPSSGSSGLSSGKVNYAANTATLVFASEGAVYPWFYLMKSLGDGVANTCDLYRISPTKTFGAIPVAAGFPGAAAASYWGAPS